MCISSYVQELAAAASKAQQKSNHVAEAPPAPKVDIDKVILEEQNRTKDLLVKLLPQEIVSALPLDATNFHSWLESAVTCIREQQECVRLSATTTPSNNSTESVHHNFNNTSRSSNNSANNNSSLNEQNDAHDGKTDEGSSKNGAPELADTAEDQQALALRNEQLQKTVDQYKIIIADTVSISRCTMVQIDNLAKTSK